MSFEWLLKDSDVIVGIASMNQSITQIIKACCERILQLINNEVQSIVYEIIKVMQLLKE